MKNLNKNLLALASILAFTSFWYVNADLQVSGSDGSSVIMTDDGNMSVSSSWSTIKFAPNSSKLFLKWKIDGYKVVLNWNKYSWSEDLLGYRVEFSWSGAENTISVWADKTTLENYDAKAWVNKYQVFAVWSEWDLAKSNEIVLKMWANGWYDFSNKSFSWAKMEMKENKDKIKENRETIKDNLKNFKDENWTVAKYMSWLTQEQKDSLLSLREERQKEVNEILVKIKAWNLTETEIAELKTELNTISDEYLAKVKEVVWDNEELLKFFQLRTELFKENQELRQENKTTRNEVKETRTEIKDTKKALRDKYKAVFSKKLEWKLDNLSADKIKAIIEKVDTLIAKYNESDLSQDKKDKLVAQLESIKGILQDKLTESEDLINVDELLK